MFFWGTSSAKYIQSRHCVGQDSLQVVLEHCPGEVLDNRATAVTAMGIVRQYWREPELLHQFHYDECMKYVLWYNKSMIKNYLHGIDLPEYTLYSTIFTSLRYHNLVLCEISGMKSLFIKQFVYLYILSHTEL